MQDRRRRRASDNDDDSLAPAPSRPRQGRWQHDSGSMSDSLGQKLSYNDFTVGWLCALPLEAAAAIAMLDKLHPDLPRAQSDTNKYTLGSIGSHNVVIACLPSGHYGTVNAAVVATNMLRTFPCINLRLMVGIGGGVPGQCDVRLGDVVVGQKVVQFDFGKTVSGGEFHMTSEPVRPPQALANGVSYLQSRHESVPSKIPTLLSEMLVRNPSMEHYGYPGSSSDRLFQATCEHDPEKADCIDCDQSCLVQRSPRPDQNIKIHHGTIASGNQVVKHAASRDKWAARVKAVCFEMEAAGLVDHFPCLVIRGICDYCDSHKNKEWQPYAAATAAAYAKELLSIMDVDTSRSVSTHPAARQFDDSKLKSEDEIRQLRKDIKKSLTFDQIGARRQTIRKAHAQTCRWFLQQPALLDWLDPAKFGHHGGFLWIKGKPGAGKSTLMKFLHDQARRSSHGSQKTLDFFFNARGSNLEKSTTGMYRSILLQLLAELPRLQKCLDWVSLPRDGQWDIPMLQDILEDMVQNLESESVAIYIDALDECDQDQIRDMIHFFDTLGQLARENGSFLNICLASRHYPHITLRDGLGLEVVLENEQSHAADISAYINNKLLIGQSNLANEIRAEIQAKASGVFMWAVLVVEILNKERDRGKMHSLRQKLREIPGDLHKLFQEILNQEQDKDEMLLCIQWVLFSKRLLTPRELHAAVLYRERIAWEYLADEDIQIFITNCSRGLVEITKSQYHTVQFIHESVRDFLLRDGGVAMIWPTLNSEFIADSHMKLAQCCLEMFKSIHRNQFSHTRENTGDVIEPTKILYSPFTGYATEKMLLHADEACSSERLTDDFLPSMQNLLDIWINAFDYLSGLMAGEEKYVSSTPLLYVLACENTPSLIKAYPDALDMVKINEEDEYLCPLIASILSRKGETVEAFRECLISYNQAHGKQANEPCLYSPNNWPYHILEHIYMPDRSTLSYLAGHGDVNLLENLILAGKLSVDAAIQKDGVEPVLVAARRGNAAMVGFLIRTGLFDLNSSDSNGFTPLFVACMGGHEACVRTLLASGLVNSNAVNVGGMSSFRYSITNDNDALAQMFLETGEVDVDEADAHGRSYLTRAAEKGHGSIVGWLLGTGKVNPDLADFSGRTPLSWAAQNARAPVIQRLLDTGQVDPDSRDSDGRTPLSWAAEYSYLAVVQCLLGTGRVDPNACDRKGRSPVWYARSSGRTVIADYILEYIDQR